MTTTKAANRFLSALALGLLAAAAFAKAAYIPLKEKVTAADRIARVRVVSTRANDRGRPYRSVATVRVLQPIKGPEERRAFEIEFDNGLGCPNVLYEAGEECLVFATRTQNGRYQTFNTYFGKYLVKDETAAGWTEARYPGRPTPWADVVAQIRKHL